VANSDDLLIAHRMLELVKKMSNMDKFIKQFGIRLTLDELRQSTLSVYQIKQAKCYTREHRDTESGLHMLSVHKEEWDILRVQLQSPHNSSKIYQLWLGYTSTYYYTLVLPMQIQDY